MSCAAGVFGAVDCALCAATGALISAAPASSEDVSNRDRNGIIMKLETPYAIDASIG